ncbi:hypothetical protein [Dyadobacter aurulentus]|nr:hypothetical protein [Dyadobacter sp. UC 10]
MEDKINIPELKEGLYIVTINSQAGWNVIVVDQKHFNERGKNFGF